MIADSYISSPPMCIEVDLFANLVSVVGELLFYRLLLLYYSKIEFVPLWSKKRENNGIYLFGAYGTTSFFIRYQNKINFTPLSTCTTSSYVTQYCLTAVNKLMQYKKKLGIKKLIMPAFLRSFIFLFSSFSLLFLLRIKNYNFQIFVFLAPAHLHIHMTTYFFNHSITNQSILICCLYCW